VLLVSAGSVEALNRNLAGLCKQPALDLPEQTLTEEAAQRQAALHWLQANPDWLLILDNVDTTEAAAEVESLLPQLSGGQLVNTTRLRNWSAAVQLHEVEVLTPEDATAFLLERTAGRRREAADDTSEARAIAVEDLGGLALALEQAGAYICQRRLSLSAYRSQWQSNRQVVLAWNEPRLTQYDRNLATNWITSYQQVSVAAHTLLRRLAWICLALAIFPGFDDRGPNHLEDVGLTGEMLAQGVPGALITAGFENVSEGARPHQPPILPGALNEQGQLGRAEIDLGDFGEQSTIEIWRALETSAGRLAGSVHGREQPAEHVIGSVALLATVLKRERKLPIRKHPPVFGEHAQNALQDEPLRLLRAELLCPCSLGLEIREQVAHGLRLLLSDTNLVVAKQRLFRRLAEES
jgi:hypothetical protein